MVSDREKMQVELENPYVLVTNHKINNLQEILQYLNKFFKDKQTIIIDC